MKMELPFRIVVTLLLLIIGTLLTRDYLYFACVILVSGFISIFLLLLIINTFKTIQYPPQGDYFEVKSCKNFFK